MWHRYGACRNLLGKMATAQLQPEARLYATSCHRLVLLPKHCYKACKTLLWLAEGKLQGGPAQSMEFRNEPSTCCRANLTHRRTHVPSLTSIGVSPSSPASTLIRGFRGHVEKANEFLHAAGKSHRPESVSLSFLQAKIKVTKLSSKNLRRLRRL